MLSPRRAPIERCLGSQHAHAYDDEDCREDRPQHLVRHPRLENDRQAVLRRHASASRAQRELTDRDAHAAGSEIAKAEDALAVGHRSPR